MHLFSSILACAGLAAASSFRDTSPFIFFSTAEILASPAQVTTADSLTSILDSALSQCLTDVYFVAYQPAVSAADFNSPNPSCSGCLHTKFLSGKSSSPVRTSFTVAQVHGLVSPAALERSLAEHCGASATSLDATTGMVIASSDDANVTKPRVVHIELPILPGGAWAQSHAAPGSGASPASDVVARKAAAQEHERMLGNMIDTHGGKSYTVLYTTSPLGPVPEDEYEEEFVEAFEYEMDNHQVPLNMELKRDLSGDGTELARRAGWTNATDPKAPLFEKYQYFTPALFQGLAVFLLLGSLLYVAIGAIAGLQVSYAAFDKETGPAAMKKQQ